MRTTITCLAAMLLAGCSKSEEEKAWDRYRTARAEELLNEMQASPTLPPTSEGRAFDVPSDPQASYRLLHTTRLQNGNLEALTRRDGPSGTSFTRIEVDCASRRYKGLGEGNTREEALEDAPYAIDWTELVDGSIKDVTVSLVCQGARA